MLTLITMLAKAFKRPELARFAAVKHDTIYDVFEKSNDNEARSAAEAAYSAGRLGLAPEDADAIVRLILATEHLGNGTRSLTEDEMLFADIDLDGLSRSYDSVLRGARDIRREFSHIPDDQFAHKLIHFLNMLEARGCIYFSPDYAHLEEHARENMDRLKHDMLRSVVNARPTDKRDI
jgi:predicted metal-dependent HD superfamily phosphohydrolase